MPLYYFAARPFFNLQDANGSLPVTIVRYVCTLLITLSAALTALAQTQPPADSPPSHSLKLNVFVDNKSGQPVANLGQQDFTILDNKSQRPITSFNVESAAAEPVHVILFLDAVNTPYSLFAYLREGVEKFLKSNEGKLAYPTTIAVLTDNGAEIVKNFASDGNALSDLLEHDKVGLRVINRSSQWSGVDLMQMSLNAFHQLTEFASTVPDRKLIVWISPGWPLISGPQVYLTAKEQDQIYGEVISLSTQMRQNNLTIYNINPVGAGESLNRADYYESFLQGVTKPGDAQLADLSIQVLAVHSGGVAIESNSDVNGMIQKCLTDAQSWYEITYDPALGEKPNEYHHIDVKLNQRGLVARTLDGYYANQQIIEPRR